jgi:hypothetical protein
LKIRTLLLVTAAAVMSATPVMAAGKSSLTAGGNTIAGPGTIKAALDEVDTLAANVDENVCVTVQNSGKGVADIRLDMTDNAQAVQGISVPPGLTTALCQNNNITVQVTCMGAKGCTYSWRVDRK